MKLTTTKDFKKFLAKMNKGPLRDVPISQLMIDPHMNTNVKEWRPYKISYLKKWHDAIKLYEASTKRT